MMTVMRDSYVRARHLCSGKKLRPLSVCFGVQLLQLSRVISESLLTRGPGTANVSPSPSAKSVARDCKM